MERSSNIHSHTHGRQREIQTHKKKALQRRKERKSAREGEKPRGGEGEPSKLVGFRHMGTQRRGAESPVVTFLPPVLSLTLSSEVANVDTRF